MNGIQKIDTFFGVNEMQFTGKHTFTFCIWNLSSNFFLLGNAKVFDENAEVQISSLQLNVIWITRILYVESVSQRIVYRCYLLCSRIFFIISKVDHIQHITHRHILYIQYSIERLVLIINCSEWLILFNSKHRQCTAIDVTFFINIEHFLHLSCCKIVTCGF